MNTIQKNNGFYAFVIFLISPLLSVFVAIRNYKADWAKNLIWLFVIFYAVSFTIPSVNSDAYRYKSDFENMARQNITLSDFFSNLYTDIPGEKFRKPFDDLIHPALAYITSTFTENFRALYLFVGIIFGYFYSRNIWFLVESMRDKVRPVHLLIIFGFALVIPFWNLNSIRMWTAAHIFFYGAMHYLQKDNLKRGTFFMIMSFFMHFSFLFPLASFILYFILGNRPRMYFIAFVLTFFINEINLGVVRNFLLSVLPDFFHGNVETFTPGEIVEDGKVRSWHARYYGLALKWTVFISVISLYLFGRNRIEKQRILLNIFSFTLLFLAVAQLGSFVPSGGRFLLIGYLFALTSLFFFTQHFNGITWIKRSFYLVSPGLIFFCLVSVRIGFDSINLGIFGNAFTFLIFGPIEIPLIDLIK